METSALTTFEPQNLQEAERLSTTLAKSALIPGHLFGKPGDVLVTLLTGRELGLAPMQALRSIAVVKGKPSLSADLMVALVKKRRDVCEYLQLLESTDERATYRAKRVGEPEHTDMTFSMTDAKAAGLTGSEMYRKFPRAMLRARAASTICRAVFPDVVLGLYDSDSGELTDGKPLEHAAPPSPPRQERASVDAEVVEAKPAGKPPSSRRGGVPNQPGLPGYVQPEVLAAQKMAQEDEKRAALDAGFDKMHELDAKTTGSVSAPRETVAKQAKVAEAKAAVERHLGKAPGTVTYGPKKGALISELSNKDLADTIDLGDAKLAESPDATWAPSVQACLDLLLAEHDKRANAQAYIARGEEG